MKSKPGIILNTLSQAGVRLMGSVCALGLTWLIARHSIEDLGVFRTLFTFFLACELLPLLGMQTYLFREMARDTTGAKMLAGHALIFGLIIAALGALFVCGLSFWSGYGVEIRQGLLLIAAGLPPTAATLVGICVLVGSGRAAHFSLIQGIETLVRTAVGIGCILLGWGILPAIAAMVVVRWLSVLGYWQAVRSLLVNLPWAFDRSFFRNFLRHVPTFAAITGLAAALRFAAQIILPWIIDETAAGQYAAAMTLVDLGLMVPTALTTSLVPILSRQALLPGTALRDACQRGLKLMAMGTLPVAAVIAAISSDMFSALLPGKPAYAGAASCLSLLIWLCSLQALDQVLSATLVSRERQDLDLKTLVFGATSLLILLVVLVPSHGSYGAAIASLCASITLVATRAFFTGKLIGPLPIHDLLWRPALAAIIAFAAARYTSQFHWLIGSAAGGFAGLATLALAGAFSQPERLQLRQLLQSNKA